MRRLWTLQEGALATSLFFQFADQAVSFAVLGKSIVQHRQYSMRHRSIDADATKEFLGIGSFFLDTKPPTLKVLDESLKYRSVSVATDEPLCIGTLMSLDLDAILSVQPKEDRMQKIWELVAALHGGITSQIIFFQELRIDTPGWKWAPKSLLQMQKGISNLNSRMIRWAEPQ